MPASTAAAHAAPTSRTGFDEAVAGFLDHLNSYRGYSIHTVKAYARDLRRFREFLAERCEGVERPDQLERPMVVASALDLKGRAPLTVQRKLSALSSFHGFLQGLAPVSVPLGMGVFQVTKQTSSWFGAAAVAVAADPRAKSSGARFPSELCGRSALWCLLQPATTTFASGALGRASKASGRQPWPDSMPDGAPL